MVWLIASSRARSSPCLLLEAGFQDYHSDSYGILLLKSVQFSWASVTAGYCNIEDVCTRFIPCWIVARWIIFWARPRGLRCGLWRILHISVLGSFISLYALIFDNGRTVVVYFPISLRLFLKRVSPWLMKLSIGIAVMRLLVHYGFTSDGWSP